MRGVLHQKEPLIPLLQFSLVPCPHGPDSTAVCFLILQAGVTDATPAHREGQRISSVNGFTPKEHDGELLWSQTGNPHSGSRNRPLSTAVPHPSPHEAEQRQGRRKDTLDLYQERRNQRRGVGSPGSGAGKHGFRPLRAWHVPGGFWALPVAVRSSQRPVQLIVVATANGGK